MSSAAQALAHPEIKAEWEKEAVAVLKKLGYPVVEGATSAVSLLPRVTTCLTRRLAALSEFIKELENAKGAKEKEKPPRQPASEEPVSIWTKSLGHPTTCVYTVSIYFNLSCRPVHIRGQGACQPS